MAVTIAIYASELLRGVVFPLTVNTAENVGVT